MSKIIFCVSLLVAYVHSGPISTEKPAEIIKYVYEPVLGNSGYRFEYETSDHQSKYEEGIFNNGTLRVNGTYTYIDTAGGTHTIRYLSDERGFSSQNVDVAASVDPNSVARTIPALRSAPIPVANNVPIVDTTTGAAIASKTSLVEHGIVPENLVVTAAEPSRVAKNLPIPTNEATPSVGPAVSTTAASTSEVKNLPVVNSLPAITTTAAPTSAASTTKAVSVAEPDVKNLPAVSTTNQTPTSVTPTTAAISAESAVKSVPVPINESTPAVKDVTTATPVVTTRASVPLPAAPTVIIP